MSREQNYAKNAVNGLQNHEDIIGLQNHEDIIDRDIRQQNILAYIRVGLTNSQNEFDICRNEKMSRIRI